MPRGDEFPIFFILVCNWRGDGAIFALLKTPDGGVGSTGS